MKLSQYGVTLALVLAAPAALPVAAQGGASETCRTATPTIIGTPGNDGLVGTSERDVIAGRGGDDVIHGRGGDDLLCGGAGADRLLGGPGTDSLFGQSDGHISTGEDDSLNVGDWLSGGQGNDLLDVGSPDEYDEELYVSPEVFDLSGRPSPVVVDLRAGTATYASGEQDELVFHGGVNHDRTVLGTRFDDTLIGTRDDDRFVGRGGDDTLRGLVGADRLGGGGGDDELAGGPDHDGSRDPIEPTSGGDELVPGPGDDVITPGGYDGFAVNGDLLMFRSSQGAVDVDLAKGVASGQGSDQLVIDGALQVWGSRYDDTLRGDDFQNSLVGLRGDDLLSGGAGADELVGDILLSNRASGRDLLNGQQGNDLLDGGPLSDQLNGGPGRDNEQDRPATNTCRSIEGHYPRGC